ncbi:amino acid permease [Acrodontium crateriforme]|uniref:Amino acid permease n=1 Tax=Acrodontium crateriforme TaxID=150365 RepID=A0AAQ3M247_9PEZI|nr:amino acid permease [Acrodontium crateriforme]
MEVRGAHYDDEKLGSAMPDATVTKTHSINGIQIDLGSEHQLERGLKSRHIQFLALGGAIGTGLFVGSGAILSTVGPAPLFMAYISMMFVVWVVMNDLAEMATYLPLRGISIPYYVGRFLDPSLAFADGWNYWYAYSILIAAETTAGAIVIDYWKNPVPTAVWITIILIVLLFLNIVAVKWFGEAEFYFASIKLLAIFGLIILGIVLFFGGGPNHDRLGFRYWKDQDGYSAFAEYVVPGATGRFLAFWHALAAAGFAFITSPELIALAAGETISPRRNIPKAARRYVWRLALFYGFGSLVIGIIVPRNNDRLLNGGSDASASPFVIGIQNAGIHGLNHVINACILTSAWSAGNAFLYSGSRVLYSMSVNGQAPKFFSKTTKYGVPWAAVLCTWLIGCLAYLNVSNTGAKVFGWFSNISTISGFIAWIVALATYIRFRKAMISNNMLHILPYRTPLQPYATWTVLILLIILTLTNGFQVFFPSKWNVSDFLAAYITLPIFLVLFLGHKIWSTLQRVKSGQKVSFGAALQFAIPIAEIDVLTGKQEMDELEALDEPRVPRNLLEKIWFWLA